MISSRCQRSTVTASSDQQKFCSFWKFRSNMTWHPEYDSHEVPARNQLRTDRKGHPMTRARPPSRTAVYCSEYRTKTTVLPEESCIFWLQTQCSRWQLEESARARDCAQLKHSCLNDRTSTISPKRTELSFFACYLMCVDHNRPLVLFHILLLYLWRDPTAANSVVNEHQLFMSYLCGGSKSQCNSHKF